MEIRLDADALQNLFNEVSTSLLGKPDLAKDVEHMVRAFIMTTEMIQDAPTVDAVHVVRCRDCVYCVPLDAHSDIENYYQHCTGWHGEETQNVWHKYKKYYKDYSIVEPDGYCVFGERKTK